MGPRANFSCKHCGIQYDDLPVSSVRCPVCGYKRGFTRLFDAVQVSGSGGHERAKMVDKYAVEALQQVKNGAPSFKQDFRSQSVPAAAAVGQVDGMGRAYSQGVAIPTIQWLGNKGGPQPGPGSRSG